ncbi:MAG: beta-lactamase family protein [Spirochaetia bacterium]|nr:beta-lactamase family protein [Spirochaetia bacterium]
MNRSGVKNQTEIFYYFSAFIVFIISFQSLFNDSHGITVSDSKQELEAWIQSYHKKGVFPSIALAVVDKNGIVYSHYINSHIHKTYGLASITKTFTSTGLMILREKKTLNLDQKVKEIFPGLVLERSELSSRPVTIRHLLTHTSGMPDLRFYKKRNYLKIKNHYPAVKIPEQIYPAGIHYRYSNHGFIIVGKIIENETRMPLNRYMFQNVFNPLGMTDTHYSEHHTGAYGLNSSMRDMARYAQFLIMQGYFPLTGQRILTQKNFREMIQIQNPSINNLCREYCGLGWRAVRINNRVITFFHIGGNSGIGAWIQIFPMQKMAVVYLSNPPVYNERTMEFLFNLQKKLSLLVGDMAGSYIDMQGITYVNPYKIDLSSYTGNYLNLLNKDKIIVYLKSGSLYLRDKEGRNYPLFPRSEYIFNGGYEFLTHQFIPDTNKKEIYALARFDGYYTKDM